VTKSPEGKRQFLRGRLANGGVRLVSGPESHLVVGLARANCLVVVREHLTSIASGEPVEVIPLTT
jgi:molybdopterin molybdotransferase